MWMFRVRIEGPIRNQEGKRFSRIILPLPHLLSSSQCEKGNGWDQSKNEKQFHDGAVKFPGSDVKKMKEKRIQKLKETNW